MKASLDRPTRAAAGLMDSAAAEASLSGSLPERDLTAGGHEALDAQVDAAISETARSVRLGEVLAARGVTTAALDGEGRLTSYHPDGTASLLA